MSVEKKTPRARLGPMNTFDDMNALFVFCKKMENPPSLLKVQLITQSNDHTDADGDSDTDDGGLFDWSK